MLIENFRPGVADEMGLGYDALRAENPARVYASISGFGSSGPARDWPGFDQIAQGHAGLMGLTGSRNAPATIIRSSRPPGDSAAVRPPAEMDARIRSEVDKWVQAAKQAGVKPRD